MIAIALKMMITIAFAAFFARVMWWAHNREKRVYVEKNGVPTLKLVITKMTILKWVSCAVAALSILDLFL